MIEVLENGIEVDDGTSMWRVTTVEQLECVAIEGGWDSLQEWYEEHNVTFEDVVGKWVQTIRGSIFIVDSLDDANY